MMRAHQGSTARRRRAYLTAALVLTGCMKVSAPGESNYSMVAREHLKPLCPGHPSVVTPEDQDALISDASRGIVKIGIPVGKLIRKDAEEVFGRLFTPRADGSEYVIKPIFRGLKADIQSSFGGAGVLVLELDMEVAVQSKSGDVLYSRRFHEKSAASMAHEAASFGFDKLAFNIMLEAANQTVKRLGPSACGL